MKLVYLLAMNEMVIKMVCVFLYIILIDKYKLLNLYTFKFYRWNGPLMYHPQKMNIS